MSADWPTFRHPLGLSFRHPPGWSVEHAQGALQILPDDFDISSELLVASGAEAQVAGVDDPAVIAYVDDSIGQAQPGLQVTANPTTMDCPVGNGMVLSYAGQLGDGRAGAAAVYSVLIEASVVSYEATHRNFINVSLPGGAGAGNTSESSSVGSWSADGKFLAVRDQQGGVVVAGTYKVFSNGIELLPAGGGELVLLARVGQSVSTKSGRPIAVRRHSRARSHAAIRR
jgi:hypothetical protein